MDTEAERTRPVKRYWQTHFSHGVNLSPPRQPVSVAYVCFRMYHCLCPAAFLYALGKKGATRNQILHVIIVIVVIALFSFHAASRNEAFYFARAVSEAHACPQITTS